MKRVKKRLTVVELTELYRLLQVMAVQFKKNY